MKANIKLTPDQWCQLTEIVVMDPDGWDRSNYQKDWAKPLTFDEFLTKAHMSTTCGGPRMTDDELKVLCFAKIAIYGIKGHE